MYNSFLTHIARNYMNLRDVDTGNYAIEYIYNIIYTDSIKALILHFIYKFV